MEFTTFYREIPGAEAVSRKLLSVTDLGVGDKENPNGDDEREHHVVEVELGHHVPDPLLTGRGTLVLVAVAARVVPGMPGAVVWVVMRPGVVMTGDAVALLPVISVIRPVSRMSPVIDRRCRCRRCHPTAAGERHRCTLDGICCCGRCDRHATADEDSSRRSGRGERTSRHDAESNDDNAELSRSSRRHWRSVVTDEGRLLIVVTFHAPAVAVQMISDAPQCQDTLTACSRHSRSVTQR